MKTTRFITIEGLDSVDDKVQAELTTLPTVTSIVIRSQSETLVYASAQHMEVISVFKILDGLTVRQLHKLGFSSETD